MEHGAARTVRLENAIREAVKSVPAQMRAVIEAWQALRGFAEISAVTVVADVGELSRFARAKQLIAYAGIVPSEDCSRERSRRGNITKTGNAHLRRVVVEAGWAYRHRPAVGAKLRKRQAQSGKRSNRSLGKHNIGCRNASESCWARVRTREL
jgi:transposase